MAKSKNIYRKVYVRMWTNKGFRGLSSPPPNGKSLWQFLLTGPNTCQIPGLIRAGAAAMAEELDWPLGGFRSAFDEIARAGMARADWSARLVYLPKALIYNYPASPSVVKSWRIDWDMAPDCDLKAQVFRDFRRTLKGGFLVAFIGTCQQPISPEGPEARPEPKEEREKKKHSKTPNAEKAEAEGAPPKPKADPVKTDWIPEMWHSKAPSLPRCVKWTDKRKAAAKARLKDYPDRADWEKAIKSIEASNFCKGGGRDGWIASIDWLLKPDTITKALEGKYNGRVPKHNQTTNAPAKFGPEEECNIPEG